jgi:hypothetical protein
MPRGHAVTVQFPDYVEAFVEHTKCCLETWDVKLVPEKEMELARFYQARTAFGTTELVLFPVNRPSGPLEYRARACTALPREYDAVFRGCEAIPNSFATLGALIPCRDGPQVWSQCIIHEEAILTEAGTMAAAMVASRRDSRLAGGYRGSAGMQLGRRGAGDPETGAKAH